MHKRGVIHGRFQVLHQDHMKYLLAGKQRCKHLVVGITNPDPGATGLSQADPRRSTPAANPLTYFERYEMLRAALKEAGIKEEEFSITPFPISFPELYSHYLPLDAVFFLTIYDAWGEEKLALFTRQGLTSEVMWRRPLSQKGITSTQVRGEMGAGRPWEHLVPPSVAQIINENGLVERLKL